MKSTYKSSGVDIKAGENTIKRIKSLANVTFNKNVLSGIGHFGAFFQPDFSGYKNPVLVSSVDGVGTKLNVAFKMDKHDTVGQDLVNHCVNDIAVCGAKPLYFMDYLAFGTLIPEKAEKIIWGFSKACIENNIALIGGETAEMPGLYDENEYDISGTIVGVVEKSEIIDGKRVKRGDVLIGFSSNGLHTNGYSLARKVLFKKFKLWDNPPLLNLPLGEELLKVHKSYLKLISTLLQKIPVKAFSHITGGGIYGNTKRVVPDKFNIKIDWRTWEIPSIFRLIKETGDITDSEMRKVFNLGVGLVAITDKKYADKVLDTARSLKENSFIMGEITA